MGVSEWLKGKVEEAVPAMKPENMKGFMDFKRPPADAQAQYEAQQRAMNRNNPSYQETKPTLIDNEVKKLPFPK